MNYKAGLLFVIALTCLNVKCLFAQAKPDDILGTWYVEGNEPAKVEIYKKSGKYFGKIVWLKQPKTHSGKPQNDKNNPDHKLRDRAVMGLQILSDLQFDGESEWINGTIYDPESGNTYTSYIWLEGKNILKVKGFIGFSLFGRTEEWSRIINH